MERMRTWEIKEYGLYLSPVALWFWPHLPQLKKEIISSVLLVNLG